MEKGIRLDKLDRILIEAIDKQPSIELAALPKEYPELRGIPYSTLYYRINSLAKEGHIRIERGRKALTCYSIERQS